LKVINVAHGTLVIFGSYVAYAVASAWGIDPILWLLIGIPLFFFLGVLIEKYLLARAVSKSADAALIIAFGIALIIQNAAQIFWSPQSRSLLTVCKAILLFVFSVISSRKHCPFLPKRFIDCLPMLDIIFSYGVAKHLLKIQLCRKDHILLKQHLR